MKIIRFDDGMTMSGLKYLAFDTDRHGNLRCYVRRHGRKIRIRDLSTIERFLVQYRAALDAPSVGPAAQPGVATPGSLRWLIERYYSAPEYTSLHESTQRKRRAILDGICAEHSTKSFTQLEQKHVRLLIRDPKAATPEAANGRVKALRQVYRWAVEVGYATNNPTLGVPNLPPNNPDGFHTWSLDEVRQFEKRHPVGSKARRTLAIFMYTGVRTSDAVQLGPQMERDGSLHFTEMKNRDRDPKHRVIPILAALRVELDAGPTGHLCYLVTEWGKPYSSPNSFGNRFKSWCRQAGLPHCSAHGLRKAGAVFAAEQGATPHQLMAIFGWKSLRQAELYTRAANEKKLAAQAMHLLDPDRTENKSVPPQRAVASSGTMRGKKS